MEYKRKAHSIYLMTYHLVFVTKYRKPVISNEIGDFMKLLCEKGYIREFGNCTEEYTRRYNADHGIAEAVVTSAVTLSEAQMTALQAKLEKISGKKISLVQKKDASVLAGLRVELEGKLLDGTVQGRLTGISKKLNEIIV